MFRTALAQLYVAGHLRTGRKPAFINLSKAAKSPEPAELTLPLLSRMRSSRRHCP